MKLTERQRYWLEHMQASEASGKGATAYAAEQGFRVGAMYAGKKMLVRKGALPGVQPRRFQRVQMAAATNDLPAVYLCRDVVDFRKGIHGLSILAEEAMLKNPFSEQLFVFCNRRRDRVKIFYWERSGFCMWQKRLEKARFKWPRKVESVEAIEALLPGNLKKEQIKIG